MLQTPHEPDAPDLSSAQRKYTQLITLCGAAVIGLAVAFGALSLSRFHAAEVAWEEHNARATAIGEAQTEINRHIGYGGFIHNVKNLVLRRDPMRYQARIESDIVNFRAQFDRLDHLLREPGDKAALNQVRTTFEDYASKYRLVAPMVAAGASSAEIDAMVQADDSVALKALDLLNSRAVARAQATLHTAKAIHAEATRFSRIGGALVVLAMVVATWALLRFLNRLVAANATIRHTREQLDLLLDTAPDAMLSVAPDGRIVRANQMAEQFFGYRNDELLGMVVEQLIPLDYREVHQAQRSQYFQQINRPRNRAMNERAALTALKRDGSQALVEISLSHSGEAAARLATVTLRDVTEREHTRQALVAAKQQAELALAQQQQMQNALVQVEKLAALGGLVAGVAHEVNTPIGVLLSAATHLSAETQKTHRAYQAGELSEEGLSDYFATAAQATQLMALNSQRAADLIQSFKQVAVDQTGGERRVFGVASYIDEVLQSLHPHLKKSPIQIYVDCPPELTMDSLPGAFSQVLTNLLMNALTHAFKPEQSGHIIIAVAEEGSQICLTFSDDGQGIAPELHARVFEPFFTTRRASGGSGLGLHIVHSIVTQSLKGTLAFDSQVGEGTIFTLHLPRSLSDVPPLTKPAPLTAAFA